MTWSRNGCVIALLLASLAAGSASAHRRHNHGHGHRSPQVGVVIGIPLTGAWHTSPYGYYSYSPAYRYSYPRAIAVQPPVYIERAPAPPAATEQPDFQWYYCPSARNYYPYVRQCPQGWQAVAPLPPDLR